MAGGIAPAEVDERIGSLQTNGPLWQLKISCIHYCRFVGGHHHFEDIGIFPALRRVDPEINPVVDRLEGEHREVAELLRSVEEAATALREVDGEESRAKLIAALETLAEKLLAHLEFEERSLEPTLAKMRTWAG